MWSKKGIPVLIREFPSPSRFRLSLILVSAVFLSCDARRSLMLVSLFFGLLSLDHEEGDEDSQERNGDDDGENGGA